MNTKNGMMIDVATLIETSSMSSGVDDTGNGWAKIFLCAEDAVNLTKLILNKAQYFRPEFEKNILSLCLHYVMNNGYSIRKAGC